MAVGNKVKGITIEFDGETTKLGKAINDINKKTRDLDSQLKSVDKALKFNPGNTELVAQKQQLLGQKVEQTKEKLDALKEAQAKLDDDPAVDKTSQDYMELRREIIETESKLEHFEKQLKDLNNIKFEQVGKQVQDVGEKMKTVGTNMSKYVTGPIVAGAGASVAAFKEVDAGLDIVTKKTGASGKELDAMKQSAKNLAQEIPTDFETAGSAIGEVNTRFGLTGQALEDLSGKFVKFAQLNDTDVSTSIDSVQKAMAAYGISAKDAGGFLDVLNKAGQDTGIGMDQLTQAMVSNAASLQAMGFDAKQAAFFVAQLEKSGVDSSAALGGLQKALVNGAKEGKSMGEVLDEVQSSIVGAGSDTEALSAATEIFGAKAAPKMATALRNGSLDLNALASAATDATDSVNKTFEDTLDPADKFTMAMNGIKITGYEVGATILEILAPAIEKFGEFIKNLSEKWRELSPETQGFILKMAGVVAVIGPALTIIGQMTIGIGGLITVLPKLIGGFTGVIGAFGKLASALMTNPWTLVAAAAIAAIVLIVKNWDSIKEFFSKLWEGIKNAASVAWEAIKQVIVGVWEAIKSAATAIFEAIKTYFIFIFNVYKTIFTTAWNAIKTVVTTVMNGIKTAISTVLNTVKSIFSGTWNAIKSATSTAWEKIKNAIVSPIEKARDLIKKIIEKIKSFFNFDFKLPHIKLPHFTISPKGWKFGDLLKGSIPSLGIDWYAKGAIFNSPTIAGVGDVKGGEAAVPLDPFWDRMDKIVEAVQENAAASSGPVFNIYAPPGMDVRQIADEVERRLVKIHKSKEAVWA